MQELQRQACLESYAILDTPPDPELDALVAQAARLTHAPIALISLVDTERQWFKARVGLEATETARNISFCTQTIMQREPFIVADARNDARFAANPLVTGAPNIAFYAGWPLVASDGHALGSLCVIDRVPRELSANQLATMAKLAKQTMLSIELHRAVTRGGVAVPHLVGQLLSSNAEFRKQELAREELAQLVVHDLKNPLTAITANAALVLESELLGREDRDALADVLAAAARMQAMLIDLLDIGLGTSSSLVACRKRIDATGLMRGAVQEVAGRPHHDEATVQVSCPAEPIEVFADAGLLSRILGNLVTNAQRYAPASSEVTVALEQTEDGLLFTVADLGTGIPDSDKQRVFEKYAQLEKQSARSNRGLGLAFCKLAAEAHGGRIWVEDNEPTGARFCVLIPREE